MKATFDSLVAELATKRGAFTLWIGAGATISLTNGHTPGWQALVDGIRQKYSVAPPLGTVDMPLQLEQLSETIGHVVFRRELRERLIDPISSSHLNAAVVASQAVIGCRAASIVSFNIEPHSAMSFLLGRGNSVSIRTFLERAKHSMFGDPETKAGLTTPPIYFPHGLLIQANVVMTQSEYDRHLGGFAVTTATHLAIGGDLLILGMSLGDSYLRDAILKNRSWIRNVYWLGSSFGYAEWARMARVTCVPVAHTRLWTGMADAFTQADTSRQLTRLRDQTRAKGVKVLANALEADRNYYALAVESARKILAIPDYEPEQITAMATFFQDIGFEIPEFLRGCSTENLAHLCGLWCWRGT